MSNGIRHQVQICYPLNSVVQKAASQCHATHPLFDPSSPVSKFFSSLWYTVLVIRRSYTSCVLPHKAVSFVLPCITLTVASRSKRLETLRQHLRPCHQTPWALNLPSHQSLGSCLQPRFSCSCNTALNLNSAPALSPCLPGRCSCSCNKSARPPRRFSVSGAGDST